MAFEPGQKVRGTVWRYWGEYEVVREKNGLTVVEMPNGRTLELPSSYLEPISKED